MPKPNPNFSARPHGRGRRDHAAGPTAEVHGVMLRYEPLPHKNTLGFWVRQDDWAELGIRKSTSPDISRRDSARLRHRQRRQPGRLRVDDQTLPTTVEETGGFQKFVARQSARDDTSQPAVHAHRQAAHQTRCGRDGSQAKCDWSAKRRRNDRAAARQRATPAIISPAGTRGTPAFFSRTRYSPNGRFAAGSEPAWAQRR